MIEIAGTTYYYMYTPILVLVLLFPAILIVLAIVNRLFFSKRVSFSKRLGFTGVMLLIAAVAMHWDVYQIGQQAKKLCNEEGGLHVYKTADVDGFKGAYNIAYWSSLGYEYVEQIYGGNKSRFSMEDGEVVKNVVDEYSSRYEVAYESKVMSDQFKRNRMFVRDRLSKEVLGELVYYSIYPGRVDARIIGALGLSFSPWICGKESQVGERRQLNYEDVVRSTLKPNLSKEH